MLYKNKKKITNEVVREEPIQDFKKRQLEKRQLHKS